MGNLPRHPEPTCKVNALYLMVLLQEMLKSYSETHKRKTIVEIQPTMATDQRTGRVTQDEKCDLNWTGFHMMVLSETADTNGYSTKNEQGLFDTKIRVARPQDKGCP